MTTGTCETCRHFASLLNGPAGICFEQWKGLPWNAAVPLTDKTGGCDKHKFPVDENVDHAGEGVAPRTKAP